MRTTELMIIVTVRHGVDLQDLMRFDGPLSAPCGVIGSSVARRVFEGGGKMLMSARELLPAFDTSEGVNAMLDNFEFTEKKTLRPLIYALLKGVGA